MHVGGAGHLLVGNGGRGPLEPARFTGADRNVRDGNGRRRHRIGNLYYARLSPPLTPRALSHTFPRAFRFRG